MEQRDSESSNFQSLNVCFTRSETFHSRSTYILVRDLAMLKEAAEILASRLSEHFVLDFETRITLYRKREENY